jgi:hypothetical protein
MQNQSFNLTSKRQRKPNRFQRLERYGQTQVEDGFRCKHCNNPVSIDIILSGVRNRNHCPYCLWSCHYDLYAAGDRLSACKSPMKPIGLTAKATWKKYGACRGELMLIHLCTECEALSINRIAADDEPEAVNRVFEGSFLLGASMLERLEAEDIHVLGVTDRATVHARLFGFDSGMGKGRFREHSMEAT